MLIVYAKYGSETGASQEGWLVYGSLIGNSFDAQLFETFMDVCYAFDNFYSCFQNNVCKTQFDVYEITFTGWKVGEHSFECEHEAAGASKVLDLPILRIKNTQKMWTLCSEVIKNEC